MKKALLSTFLCFAFTTLVNAQTVIHDNGPLVNQPGQGAGGADVSALEPDIHNFGYNNRLLSGFRMAEDIVVPAGETWNIDSLVFFAYQTQTSPGGSTISTITGVNLQIWDGPPDNLASMVIYGDTTLNILEETTWTGIWRTSSSAFTNTQRGIMRNSVATPGLSLSTGTYWIDYQHDGSLTSGPWIPPVTISGQPITGNALQFSPNAGAWQVVYGDTLNTYPQGMPFLVIGSVISGVSEVYSNSFVTISPNPFSSTTVFHIDKEVLIADKTYLNIYDATGRIASHIEVNSTSVTFERGSLSQGFYSYELVNNSGKVSIGKIVIQ